MSLGKRVTDALSVLRGVKTATDQSGGIAAGVSTEMGATFGETLTTENLLFAVKREPIAYRIVYAVACDTFDKWFEVDDIKDEGGDESLEEKVQETLNELDAKHIFTEMAAYERLFGYAVIVKGYRDGADLKIPVRGKAPIEDLAVYTALNIVRIEEDQNLDSPRFGLPEFYILQRGTSQIPVHYTRCIHVASRLLTSRYLGLSVLEPVWDDLTCLRNIRWGMAQTLYRYGSGFPDITIKGATKGQLEDFTASGVFKNVHARTYFVHNENQTMEFKGMEGSALNPTYYYEPILENISAGCGIPKAILRGAQAGALTGSEVNLSEYFKIISDAQGRYEIAVRELLDELIERGQIKTSATDYKIEWASGFEHSDTEQAQIEVSREQAQISRTNYMTINEVREMEDLPPLPGPEGELVLGIAKLTAAAVAPPKPEETPEEEQALNEEEAQAGDEHRHDADPKPGEAHPSLVVALKGIVNRCLMKNINRNQAIEEARTVINEYVSHERARAASYIRSRTGQKVQPSMEMEKQFHAISEEYLRDFESILDDSLKNGGIVE